MSPDLEDETLPPADVEELETDPYADPYGADPYADPEELETDPNADPDAFDIQQADPEELEIEKLQEAEMLKLAHGGFSNMIDFEAAVKDGSAKDFHAKNGYPGMMGGVPPVQGGEKVKAASDDEKVDAKEEGMPATGAADQVILDAVTDSPIGSETKKSTEATVEVVADPEPEPEEVVADVNNDALGDAPQPEVESPDEYESDF